MYQIVGFHFRVKFLAFQTKKGDKSNDKEIDIRDIRFQSVTGLDVQIDRETIKEGGVNEFEHSIPGRTKYTTLTLKRGILKPEDSGLTEWCHNAFQNRKFKPLETVLIELMNNDRDTILKWQLSHVWPVSWKIGELNAERGEVLLETLELNYNRFKLVGEQ